ncbi:hypothetical protein B4135_1936 [Caldibacillus debilis]|uniref:Uncharacterized protein n=1 Tax=Caldibacillus debilis TaxID=301148 RepID=A0A150M740_9BACI|nr:hypothetical protein B4135_1936 [Caldibacillus debilis]
MERKGGCAGCAGGRGKSRGSAGKPRPLFRGGQKAKPAEMAVWAAGKNDGVPRNGGVLI